MPTTQEREPCCETLHENDDDCRGFPPDGDITLSGRDSWQQLEFLPLLTWDVMLNVFKVGEADGRGRGGGVTEGDG